ncbi:uncharacterized protein LOC122506103 [Leptopilina heterotoma]|uniref:uncharacterized protein LOC122506103 n=1 Tax=Leptopilina heterotoma TaxID=63436 RepID=UPI001CA8055E|nr:uncharacterized protein LOC122506103 [Leptopilina heterotoma]
MDLKVLSDLLKLDTNGVTFSSNQMFREIKLYDTTIEVIGFIDEIKDLEAIVHIDGISARPIAAVFNKGTTSYELLCQSNTIINIFGKQTLETSKTSIESLPLVGFNDLGKYSGKTIRINGFLKTVFKQSDRRESYLSGSITDGVHNLEVRLTDRNCVVELAKGDPIQIGGIMNFTNVTYFAVNNYSNVLKREKEPKMSLKLLLKASKMIKRVIENESDEQQNAKKIEAN